MDESGRLPFFLQGEQVGSVAPGVLDAVAGDALLGIFLRLSQKHGGAWHAEALNGRPLNDGLHVLAHALCGAGLGGRWRSERLAVCNASGKQLAAIERAAVRTLGIATRAVHLMGAAPNGSLWVQQRALDKDTDPGLWDTLVGGMVPDGETPESALERESMEEAGLSLASLQNLKLGGTLQLHRPSPEAQGRGLLVERLDWYLATVPAHLEPNNTDGEVAQFACLGMEEVCAWSAEQRFTVDAQAIVLQWLDALEI